MPTKGHKTDYLILGFLGALTAAVLFALVFWGWIQKDNSGGAWFRTTYSSNVNGAIVCYTLFERLGIPVERSEEHLFSDALDEIDVLFMLDQLIPIHSGELRDIHSWLVYGGVLVCTRIPSGLNADLDTLRRLQIHSYYARDESDKPEKPEATFIPTEHKGLPLARDISKIHLKTFEVFDVNTLDSNHPEIELEPLLFDSRGLRIAAYKLGRGRLIILPDSSFLANGQIGKGDNSVLAVNLVSHALSLTNGKKAVFDEHHFGYGSYKTGLDVLGGMLFTTTAGWTVLSLTATGVLFMVYKGRRFGYRRGLEKKRRRSKLEYVYAVGSTYRSAGANRLTLKIILNQLKRKAAGLVGLAENASNGAIAAKLSHRSGANPQRYTDVLNRCDKLLAQTSVSERNLFLITKRLAQIEMEVFHEHRNRK